MPFWEKLISLGVKEIFKQLTKKESKTSIPAKKEVKSEPEEEVLPKSHPWRFCPIGEHWVRKHLVHYPPSKNNPKGKVGPRREHCAENPKRSKDKLIIKDFLSIEEMYRIAETYFPSLTELPSKGKLPFKNADKYDEFIQGWTKYWNEVFTPKEPLDPDLVKALIASESGFNPNPTPQKAGSAGMARGLIQLTDQTIKVLGNPDGELKNHLVEVTKDKASDPNIAIAAGIRWLFHKKELAKSRLGREASWDESIAEYKSYSKEIISGKNRNPKGMNIIRAFYSKLKK